MVSGFLIVLILTQLCEANQEPHRQINIFNGEFSSSIIFAHFDPDVPLTVRNLLSSRTGDSWVTGDWVIVFENGHPGQNWVMLSYNVDKWSPANINPIHRIDNVYHINRVGESSGLLSLTLPNAPNVIPTTHECTVGAGMVAIRKSAGAANVQIPMMVRLNNIQDTPTATVQITYNN